MTQEEKELLLFRDLSSRWAYGVKILFGKTGIVLQLSNISQDHCFSLNGSHIFINKEYPIQWCKPYLRSLSSMTEEESEEYNDLTNLMSDYDSTIENIATKIIDWLNEHHFDYRGLIEKGLALEAPGGMYES